MPSDPLPGRFRSICRAVLAVLLIVFATGCGDSISGIEEAEIDYGEGAVAPQTGSGFFTDDLLLIRSEDLTLLSAPDEITVGVYRFHVNHDDYAPVEVGRYIVGTIAETQYLRRITYSSMDGELLTLGTVPAYWPEVVSGGFQTVSMSLERKASVSSAVVPDIIPFSTGNLSFNYDLCTQIDEWAPGTTQICDLALGTACEGALGVQVCGNLTRADIFGQVSVEGIAQIVFEVDAGRVIPGRLPVYYPCNTYPAACLYTGICIVGAPVVIPGFPPSTETCRLVSPGVLPTVVPPSIIDLRFDASQVALKYDVNTTMAGDFRFQLERAIPTIGFQKTLPWSGALGLCGGTVGVKIGDFLRLYAEWSEAQVSMRNASDGVYNASVGWSQARGFNPTSDVLRLEAIDSIEYDKADSLTLGIGILAKIGASFNTLPALFPNCPWSIDALFEATAGDVVEDIASRPTPCTTEDRTPVSSDCFLDMTRHDRDVFADFRFEMEFDANVFGRQIGLEPRFRENECKYIPSWVPDTCRLDLVDTFSRGDITVVVTSEGQVEDFDTDGYDIVLSRTIPHDTRNPGSVSWEPVAEQRRVTVPLENPSGSVFMSESPDATIFDPNALIWTPLCKTRIRDNIVERENCTLVSGIDHALRLENVAKNCFVRDAVVDGETLMERDFYRIVQLKPNRFIEENFEVVCEDMELVFGTVHIETLTTGNNIDQNGYTLFTGNTALGPIGPNETRSFMLPAGSHGAALGATSIAENCSLVSAGLVDFQIEAGGETHVQFEIDCVDVASQFGSIEFTAHTEGQDIDPNGFLVAINGSTAGVLAAVGGSLQIDGIAVGQVSVEMLDIAGNCLLNGDNPRNVEVLGAMTSMVPFHVTCTEVPRYGQVQVTTASSGRDIPAQYTVRIGSATWPIGANGVVEVTADVGLVGIELIDVPPHCSVAAPNPLSAHVEEDQTASGHFEVFCKNEHAASSTSLGGTISIVAVIEEGAEDSKKQIQVTDQVLEVQFGGTIEGSGVMTRSYRLNGTESGRASGSIELVAHYNGSEGSVSGTFQGAVSEGNGAFSYKAAGDGGLSKLNIQIQFEGPLEGPFTYTGRVLDPNEQGPK